MLILRIFIKTFTMVLKEPGGIWAAYKAFHMPH